MKKEGIFKRIFSLFRDKYFYIGLSFFILSLIVNFISNWLLINKHNPQLFPVYDLILNNIPYYNIAFLYDVFISISIILFILYIYNDKKDKYVGYYFYLFGLFFIIKAFFVLVNPFSTPVPSYNQIFSGVMFDISSFPSGHTGICFLIYLLLFGNYRKLALVSLIGTIISLFLSRGHYTFEIIGSMFIVYAIYVFSEQHIRKYFIRK